MTTTRSLLERRPVLSFYLLTFFLSWGGMLLVLGFDPTPAATGEIERLMALVYVALLAGPTVAALLLTALLGGRQGLRRLATRLGTWRVGARWYAIALLSAPLAAMLVLYTLSLISPDYLPRIVTTEDRTFLVQFSVISALIVAIFVELGWTGFAVPRLRMRRSILRTGLIAGLLWGAWQSFVVYWGIGDSAGTLPPGLFVPIVLATWLPSFRVLMTWVYERTESVFLAIVMHTSLIASWTMLTPLTIKGWSLLLYYLSFSAALWLIIAAVAAANHGSLSQPPRVKMA